MILLYPKNKKAYEGKRAHWFYSHEKASGAFALIYCVALLILIPNFTMSELLYYLHLGIVVLVYEPILRWVPYPLRKISYLKTFIISYVWTMSCAYPAYKMANASILWPIECFVFIWCLTMAFDIRDYSNDKNDELKTLISLWGIRVSKIIVSTIFIVNIFILHTYLITGHLWVSAFITIVFLGLLSKINDDHSDFYLIIGMDSIMIFKLLYLI